MNPLMPDLDALVLSALRAADLGATVSVKWPQGTGWASSLPLVVAHQVAGGDANRMGRITGLVDVQCVATDRKEASALARTARVALADACTAQFRGSDGYLSHFYDVTAGPTELTAGTTATDPELFRFQAVYRVSARPL